MANFREPGTRVPHYYYCNRSVLKDKSPGEPSGTWVKLRGVDSLAFYNFREGKMVGMQMETDEETAPPERHYFELTKTGEDSTILVIYNSKMKPEFRCALKNSPYRVRYQSPYWYAARFDLLYYFTSADCQTLSMDER